MSCVPFSSALFLLAAQETYHPPVQKLTPEIRAQVISEIDQVIKTKAFAIDFDPDSWMATVKKHQSEIDKCATPDELCLTLTVGMMDIRNSHMALVATKSMRHITTNGIGLIPISDNGMTFVWRVCRGSAAEKAGIRAGDQVLWSQNPTADDPKGKPAYFRIKSVGRPQRTVKVQPGPYEMFYGPSLTEVSPKTAVLDLPTFTYAYDIKETEALVQKANRYDNLLIDLRGNGGGQPDRLLHFLGMFAAEGSPIGTFVSKAEADEYVKKNGKPTNDLVALSKLSGSEMKLFVPKSSVKYRGRIAILIGNGTGSASEMVAQSLRECRNAPCIGQQTAGAVLFPNGEYIPSGYLLEYPFMDYVSARGRRLENNPIQPDLYVKEGTTGWPGHPDPIWRTAAKFIER